jgi:hypothetical protein
MFSGISCEPARPAQQSSPRMTTPGMPAVHGTRRTAVRSVAGPRVDLTSVRSTSTKDAATTAQPPSR